MVFDYHLLTPKFNIYTQTSFHKYSVSVYTTNNTLVPWQATYTFPPEDSWVCINHFQAMVDYILTLNDQTNLTFGGHTGMHVLQYFS